MYGPPGTGKTSTLLALARQLYGPELMKSRVLELNASDERGIDIVRVKIKNFARQQLSNPPAGPAGVEYMKKYPVPPFKMIILDEADSMTQDAQSALRRTMETYSKITRFCLVCNYVTRIIDPLASRCSKFRFKSLDKANAGQRLEDIAKLEGVSIQDGAIDALVRCSDGDLRKAITFLQSAARLVGALAGVKTNGDAMDVDGDERVVTVRIVEEIAGIIPASVIDRLYEAMKSHNGSSNYDAIAEAVEDLVADGWSGTQVMTQLYEKVMYDELVSDKQKTQVVMIFSEVDKRLVDGVDEQLAILDLAVRVSSRLSAD
jgi:replication factor C subunit 2/4